jgi:hypothetical protein
MKMPGKAVLKFVVIGLLVSGAMAALSFAQSAPVATGSFTLPLAARWGSLNLNPGTYSFEVNRGGNNYVLHVEQGGRAVGFILTSEFSSREAPQLDEAALLCVRRSGGLVIGTLKMPKIGVFYFNAPQSRKAQLTENPDLIQRVPVLLAKN